MCNIMAFGNMELTVKHLMTNKRIREVTVPKMPLFQSTFVFTDEKWDSAYFEENEIILSNECVGMLDEETILQYMQKRSLVLIDTKDVYSQHFTCFLMTLDRIVFATADYHLKNDILIMFPYEWGLNHRNITPIMGTLARRGAWYAADGNKRHCFPIDMAKEELDHLITTKREQTHTRIKLLYLAKK